MSKLERMRRGIKRLIDVDKGIGIVTRQIKADNGLDGKIPTGETVIHKLVCRVTYQSGSVWPSKQWEGGLTIDTSPYALAYHDADIEQGDTLEWRGRKYTVGAVTRPELDGGATCTQAPLVEVK